MKSKEISESRKLIYSTIIVIGIAAILGLWAVNSLFINHSQDQVNSGIVDGEPAAGSPEKFALLSGQAGERSVGST